MMLKKGIIILFLVISQFVIAQKDTLKLHGVFNLQGRYQTGNLNQFSSNLLTKGTLINSKWYVGVSVNYTYAKIEGYNAVNDFWSSGVIKRNHSKNIYPVGIVYSGFAKSFGIVGAYIGGLGVGGNIIKASTKKLLNINLIGGYSRFNYAQVKNVEGIVANIFISSRTKLFKNKIELNWEFHGYYLPNSNLNISGTQNSIRISVPIKKTIKLTAMHQHIYNSYVDTEISKINSMLLFGISIQK